MGGYGYFLESHIQKLKKLPDQTSLKASFITTCKELLNCVCGRTPCNDIHEEALLKSFQASDITIKGQGISDKSTSGVQKGREICLLGITLLLV